MNSLQVHSVTVTHGRLYLARWHWRAFLTGGGSAFWLLAYGLFYWASRLSLGSVQSALLYLGYLLLIVLFDFLVTGETLPFSYVVRSRSLNMVV